VNKRKIRRPRRKWEDHIRMYFKTEWESIDWVQRDEYMDQWLAVLFTVMEI